MKLVLTLLVRDEEDILDAHLWYHLRSGVDFVIAMDHRSTDATAAILRKYEAQGRLEYLYQGADNFDQGRWVTEMARHAATEHGADWVINSDADEFWWPRGRTLKEALGRLRSTCSAAVVERTDFPPVAGKSDPFFADRMTVRDRRSVNALGRRLPPKTCHRGFADVVVEPGNHRVTRVGGGTLPSCRAPIEILHFPVRSFLQFERKVASAGAAVGRNVGLPPGSWDAWRSLYRLLGEGTLEAHYDSLVLDGQESRRALRRRRFVRDERLKHIMQGFNGRP